jgi:O-antigen/teichoic acid export membrane protein
MTCLILTLTVTTLYQATAILRRLKRIIPPGPAAYRPREWLRGSAPFTILHGSSYLSSFADVLVLSLFVSPWHIATYFAATRIIQVVNLVPFAAMVGTAHRFAAAHARGDRAGLQQLNNQVSVATFAIAVVSVAAIVPLGHWLLEMFGNGYESGYAALLILAVGVVARIAAGPAEDVLNMTGNGALSASTYFGAVVVNVALNLALIGPFGITGAAVATSVALTGRAVWLSLAVRRRLGVSTSIFAAFPSRPPGRAVAEAAE